MYFFFHQRYLIVPYWLRLDAGPALSYSFENCQSFGFVLRHFVNFHFQQVEIGGRQYAQT